MRARPPASKPRIPRVASVREVAEKIRRARNGEELGRVVFLIGAGCSVSAGIPGAPNIARMMVVEIARQFGICSDSDDSVTCYRILVNNDHIKDAGSGLPIDQQADHLIDWYRVYDEMFERHYSTRDETRELFNRIVQSTNGAINWAHLCLGELVARGFISTVLTTNFDQLVLSGIVRAGVLPVVCDGIESLNRIAAAPRHQQLIELHGSRHTYVLRNRLEDVRTYREDPIASGAIQNLIQNATTFVVIGYAGREEGIMSLLIQAAEVFDDKNLFWIQHSSNPDVLSEFATQFLSTTRNGGLVLGQDADCFFLELCQALGVGAPTAVSDPLKMARQAIKDVSASAIKHRDIEGEIERARTSLLVADRALLAKSQEGDPVSSIRELRLAGRHRDAYVLAEEALGT